MKNSTTPPVPTFFNFLPVFGKTCDHLVMALHGPTLIEARNFSIYSLTAQQDCWTVPTDQFRRMRKWTCCSLLILPPQQHFHEAAFLLRCLPTRTARSLQYRSDFSANSPVFTCKRLYSGQVLVGRIAKKRIFRLDFITALNDGAGNTFLTIRRNCAQTALFSSRKKQFFGPEIIRLGQLYDR